MGIAVGVLTDISTGAGVFTHPARSKEKATQTKKNFFITMRLPFKEIAKLSEFYCKNQAIRYFNEL